MMQKRKEKSKRGNNANHLDFVSPLNSKQCIERLEAAQRKSGFLTLGIAVKFFQLDANTCEFVVRKGTGAQIRGRLINEYGVSTRVECFASMTPNAVIVNVGGIALSLLILASAVNSANQDSGSSILLFGFVGLITCATVYQNIQAPRQLLRDVEQLLLKTED